MTDPSWTERASLTDGWAEQSWVVQTWTEWGALSDGWVENSWVSQPWTESGALFDGWGQPTWDSLSEAVQYVTFQGVQATFGGEDVIW